MITGEEISLKERYFISFESIPRRIAVSHGNFIINFFRNLHTVRHNDYTDLHSHQHLTPFPTLSSFSNSHPCRCEVMSHCGFDLHFSDNQ
jgi:hypothetical protein